jgi:hypothetical protein
VPAHFFVDLGAQAHGDRDSGELVGGLGGRVEVGEVRPDDHDLALAEGLAISGDLFLRVAAGGIGVQETAQRLRHSRKGCGHVLVIQARGTEDPGLDQRPAGFRRQQCLHAEVLARGRYAADDVGFRFGRRVAFLHAHDDADRVGLAADAFQRTGERAGGAGFAHGGLDVGDEHRAIQGEHGRIGVGAGGDQADNGRSNSSDGTRTAIDLDDPYTVVIIGRHLVASAC